MPISTRIRGTLIRSSRYPPKAAGSRYSHLRLIARRVNEYRCIVRLTELGEWRKLLTRRIPERITTPADES